MKSSGISLEGQSCPWPLHGVLFSSGVGKALQRKLAEKEIIVEYSYMLRDLQQLRAVELNIGDNWYLCRTELAGKAYETFRSLGIRPPLQVCEINKTNLASGDNKQDSYIPPLF